MCDAVRDLVVNVALDDDRDLDRERCPRASLSRARVALDAY